MTKGIKKMQVLLSQVQIGHSWTTGEMPLDRSEEQIRNIIFSCHYVPEIVWDIWEYSPPSALTYALDINNARKYGGKILDILAQHETSLYKQTNHKSICKLVWSMFQYDPASACRYVATIQQRQGFIPTQYDELVHQQKRFDETIKINSFFSDNADLAEVGLDEKALLLTFSSRNALNILSGKKTVEVRKNKPRFIDCILVYERETKQIVGSFKGNLIGKKTSQDWIELYGDQLLLTATEIKAYLGTSMGYGIGIQKVEKFSKPIAHSSVIVSSNNPSNKEFRYLSSQQVKELGILNDK